MRIHREILQVHWALGMNGQPEGGGFGRGGGRDDTIVHCSGCSMTDAADTNPS